MIALEQSASSTEPIQLQVKASTLTGGIYNPTGDTVWVAILPNGTPAPDPQTGPWQAAEWQTDAAGLYWATIFVGPLNDAITLLPGTYIIYLKVTDNPAVPVKRAAYLIIY